MGRNPVVGRQGPEYHAATVPSEQAGRHIAVKQIRSEIGHPETMRRTLRALGLRHHQQTWCSVSRTRHPPAACSTRCGTWWRWRRREGRGGGHATHR